MELLTRGNRERGAIIIHVAFALLALLAFSAFVVDMGVMWVSRRQAQNAADAGALAGAVALMRDGGSSTEAAKSALQWASNNAIFGRQFRGNVRVTFSGASGTCGPSCDISPIPPCGDQPGCVRVDVFRSARIVRIAPARRSVRRSRPFLARSSASPSSACARRRPRKWRRATWCDACCRLLWPTDGRTRLTRTSTPTWFANDGNHLPGDPIGGWSPNDLYQDAAGGGTDSYIPPYHTGHTGWTVTGDYGRQLVLKDGAVGQFSAGWANKVDLPGSTGANDYRQDIRGCNADCGGHRRRERDLRGIPAKRDDDTGSACRLPWRQLRPQRRANRSGRRESRRRWWIVAARRSGSRRAVELVGRGPGRSDRRRRQRGRRAQHVEPSNPACSRSRYYPVHDAMRPASTRPAPGARSRSSTSSASSSRACATPSERRPAGSWCDVQSREQYREKRSCRPNRHAARQLRGGRG